MNVMTLGGPHSFNELMHDTRSLWRREHNGLVCSAAIRMAKRAQEVCCAPVLAQD
ncbi:MAG TPA: hypothetical protein VFQ00_12605 [Terriglobales bacterium]|nr:hypothetical protein [Terriglobales bacterium]